MDTTGDLQLLEDVPVRPGTKLAALVAALRRPQGATSLQLILTTGWQPHTARGAISGMLRKKFGLNVVLASGYIAWSDHHRQGVNSTHALVGWGANLRTQYALRFAPFPFFSIPRRPALSRHSTHRGMLWGANRKPCKPCFLGSR